MNKRVKLKMQLMEESCDCFLKVVLVGDTAVGKTSLLRRFTTDKFKSGHEATIGVDFAVTHLEIDGKNIMLQIWDTAGQEKFKSLTLAYYRNAHACVVVYDISNGDSFLSCRNWIKEIAVLRGDVPKVLLGNKYDKCRDRTVTSNQGEQFVAKNNLMWFLETSAKDGTNVEKAFHRLAKNLSGKLVDSMDSKTDSIKLESPTTNSSSWACCREKNLCKA